MFCPATINQIQAHLEKQGLKPQFQKETNQIYLITLKSGIELVMFLRLLSEGELLQIITFVPVKIRQETLNDLSRLLHKLNRDLDFPGFGIDEDTGIIFFRVVMPCLNRQCDLDILEKHLEAVPKIVVAFYKVIDTIVKGETTFDELLKLSLSSKDNA
jgi:hypothetical protein